jgi:hypothetical protein
MKRKPAGTSDLKFILGFAQILEAAKVIKHKGKI